MPVIEVEHLHKHYRGPNGAGKTTTVEIIEGLRTPDRGTVRVLGLDPRWDREELRLAPGAGARELERTLTGNLLAVAELVGTYER